MIYGGQQQVVSIAGSVDSEPAHLRSHLDIVMDLEAEMLGVEGECRIQVSAEDGRVRDGKCHVSDPTHYWPGMLLRSCMVPRSIPGVPRLASYMAGPVRAASGH